MLGIRLEACQVFWLKYVGFWPCYLLPFHGRLDGWRHALVVDVLIKHIFQRVVIFWELNHCAWLQVSWSLENHFDAASLFRARPERDPLLVCALGSSASTLTMYWVDLAVTLFFFCFVTFLILELVAIQGDFVFRFYVILSILVIGISVLICCCVRLML